MLWGYKKSALFAMLCGMITCAIGLSCLFQGSSAWIGAVTAAVLVNMILHAESFYSSLREEKRQESVLAITLMELFFVLFGLHTLLSRGGGDRACFFTVFSFYLIAGGAALAAMPVRLAQMCGALAMGTALLVYAAVQVAAEGKGELLCACAVCASLVVNGAERILMSIRAEKGQKAREKKEGEK